MQYKIKKAIRSCLRSSLRIKCRTTGRELGDIGCGADGSARCKCHPELMSPYLDTFTCN